MENWIQTVESQYGNSTRILALIEAFNEAVDPSPSIDAWYNSVWNISTAVGFGLDVWGRIVGVGRILEIPGASKRTFGFGEAGAISAAPFGQGTFYAGPPASVNYSLSDGAYRQLILCKAYANICNSSIASYNRLLTSLFAGRGRAYVLDLGNMAAQLTFEFALLPYERAILQQSGAFTPPTGVRFTIIDFDPATTAGFAESGATAVFGTGVFYKG